MRHFRKLSSSLVALSLCLIGSNSVYSQEAKGSQGPPVIENIAKAINDFVHRSEAAGVLTMVVERNGTRHLHAVGMSDIDNGKPINADSIFWIASMSKPITGACVMILVDEGKLSLDEPITKYLPEMSQLKLADGTSPTITLKHLLTHTSGMAELPSGNGLYLEEPC
jgi:CubicO group peptidase (beta-lactamase class C family)